MANIPTDFRKRRAGMIQISDINPYEPILRAQKTLDQTQKQGMDAQRRLYTQAGNARKQTLGANQRAQMAGSEAQLAAARDMGAAEQAGYTAEQQAIGDTTKGLVSAIDAVREFQQKNEEVEFEAQALGFDNWATVEKAKTEARIRQIQFKNPDQYRKEVAGIIQEARNSTDEYFNENVSDRLRPRFDQAKDRVWASLEAQAEARVPSLLRADGVAKYNAQSYDLINAGEFQRAWSLFNKTYPRFVQDPEAVEAERQRLQEVITKEFLEQADLEAQDQLLNEFPIGIGPGGSAEYEQEALDRIKSFWSDKMSTLRGMFGEDDQRFSAETEQALVEATISQTSSAIVRGYSNDESAWTMDTFRALAEQGWTKEAFKEVFNLPGELTQKAWNNLSPQMRAQYQKLEEAQYDNLEDALREWERDPIKMPWEKVEAIAARPGINGAAGIPLNNRKVLMARTKASVEKENEKEKTKEQRDDPLSLVNPLLRSLSQQYANAIGIGDGKKPEAFSNLEEVMAVRDQMIADGEITDSNLAAITEAILRVRRAEQNGANGNKPYNRIVKRSDAGMQLWSEAYNQLTQNAEDFGSISSQEFLDRIEYVERWIASLLEANGNPKTMAELEKNIGENVTIDTVLKPMRDILQNFTSFDISAAARRDVMLPSEDFEKLREAGIPALDITRTFDRYGRPRDNFFTRGLNYGE